MINDLERDLVTNGDLDHAVADAATLVDRDVEAEADVLTETVPQLCAPAGIGRSEVGTIVTRADARIGRKRGVKACLLDFHIVLRTGNLVLTYLQLRQIVSRFIHELLQFRKLQILV